jgi:hypothetical protein
VYLAVYKGAPLETVNTDDGADEADNDKHKWRWPWQRTKPTVVTPIDPPDAPPDAAPVPATPTAES